MWVVLLKIVNNDNYYLSMIGNGVSSFWSTNLVEKMEVVTIITRKAKYSYGQACISFFVNQGLQMFIHSISMLFSESLDYSCDPKLEYI